MKKSIEIILSLSLFGLLLFTLPAYAHHPAADIVDAEIYAIIDELVSDTPHADLVFDDDMGGGGDTMLTITGSLRSLEQLVDDGLLSETADLSGDVSIIIEFTDRRDAVLTIVQTPE